MRAYVIDEFSGVIPSGAVDGPPTPPSDPSNVPSEFRWVQGFPHGTCVGEMEITNIGDVPLQV